MIPINRPDISSTNFKEYINVDYNVNDLELAFSSWLGGERDNLITSSGKMAIYLLFKHLNLTGKILTSPLCCSMAYTPIIANGLKLSFVDIESYTFCMDIDLLERQIDSDTSAIYIAHLGGVSPDMKRLKAISNRHNIILIEDCSQALGSKFDNKKLGTYGDYSCFSFSKNTWLSGGGAISAKNNNKLLDKIRRYQNDLPEVTKELIKYRFKRDILESKRGLCKKSDSLYYSKFYKKAKNSNIDIDYSKYFNNPDILSKPSKLQKIIILSQIKDLNFKNRNRNSNANIMIDMLSDKYNFQILEGGYSIYSKLYLTSKSKIFAC